MTARETIESEGRELVRQLSPLYLEKILAAERVGEERGEQRGRQEGEVVGEVRMILRLLNRRLGSLPDRFSSQIQQLTIPQLEDLGEALLYFTILTDLEGWLGRN